MSYVQGTSVRLWADFTDPDTRQPVTPDEVTLTVKPPTGVAFQRTRSGGQVLPDPSRAGRFYYVLDTGAEPGNWQYEFEGIRAAAAKIVERKTLTVQKRLAAA